MRSVYVSKNYPKNLQPSSHRVVEGEKKLKANRVLREDISSGEPCLPPEQSQYLSLIQSFAQDKTPNRALKILDHAREKKQVHAKHYGAVIKVCNRTKQPWKALEVLQKMKDDTIQPNVVIYSTLLHGFAKRRDLRKTEELFRDMIASEIKPNLVTYSSLIHAHSVHGDVDGVKKVFTEMVSADIRPDAFIIADMIAACAADANLPQAFEFYELVSRLKLAPELSVFHAYMKCARSAQRPNLCMKLYDRLIESGLSPTLDTYSHLLSCLAKPETSYEFGVYWSKMIEQFGQPNEYCWAAKLNLLNLQGKHREVISLDSQVVHSRVSRHEMIRAFLARDDFDGALQYFDNMPQRTYEHYRALLAHYVEQRDFEALDKLFLRGIESKELHLKWNDEEVDLHFFDRNVCLAAIRYVLQKSEKPFSVDLICGRGLETATTLKKILPEFIKNHLDVRLRPSRKHPDIALLLSI